MPIDIISKSLSHFISVAKSYNIQSGMIMKRTVCVRLLCSFVYAAVLSLVAVPCLTAQPTGSRGKDFWLAFMPNFHPNGLSNDPRLRFEDSLYIYIAATAPTRVTISYPDLRTGKRRDTILTIANTDKVYAFSVTWEGYELEGFNHSGQITGGGQNEIPASQTFHIVSEQDISVYALSQARTTSDAFLALPTPVLGVDHYVMSYNSDGFLDNYNNLSSSVTPSQFVIVAAYNNTQIRITPTAPTRRSGKNIKTAILNAGEAYLVQAQITSNNLHGDLTGTRIVSSNPVAVFGGHQRATLPLEYRDRLTSRDCLIEQIPSVEVWGKSSFLVPYPQPRGASLIGTDLFRVLAAFDSTPILLDGNQITLLNAGEFYEGKLRTAGIVSSTKPILVAQFKKTSGEQGGSGSGNTLRLGDPFMMLIPPAEQFLNFYRCINAQAWELSNVGSSSPAPVYENQYITVVAPNTTISSIRIDGKPLVSAFTPIPNSAYSYAWEAVNDGAHTVEADEPIGIYVYGYGLANSYGYVGDMNFRAFDYSPPQLASAIRCYTAKGVWYDSTRGDTRLRSVAAPPDSQINVSVDIEPFTPFSDSVGFSAVLKDIFNDGLLNIHAQDSVGLVSYAKIPIPGFTLRAESAVPPEATVQIISDAPIKKDFCHTIKIRNYGEFTQTVTGVRFKPSNPAFRSTAKFPIIIPPGNTADIEVCFFTNTAGIFYDSMAVFNDCGERTTAIFSYYAKGDTLTPTVTQIYDPCGTEFKFDIFESSPIDLGIADIELIDSATKNCVLSVERTDGNTKAHAVVKVDDIYTDAYYLLKITDSAGNQRLFSDTIPGLTVSVSSITAPPNDIIRFDSVQLGDIICDTVIIHNYGRFPLFFRQISPIGNIIFSTPQTQFPISLAPGERQPLIMCYSPAQVKDTFDRDTLRFELRCLTRDFPLQGGGVAPIIRTGDAQCDISLVSRSISMPSAFYLKDIQPNPAQRGSEVSLRFALPDVLSFDLSIYDTRGVRQAVAAAGAAESGEYYARIVTEQLASGLYCIVLRANEKILSKTFIIQ